MHGEDLFNLKADTGYRKTVKGFSGPGQAEQMRTVGIFHNQLLQKITPITSKITFWKT